VNAPPPLRAAELVAFAPTADLERAHAFYGGVLGLERVEASPFANAYDAHGTQLRVTRVEDPPAASFTVLGWTVPDIAATIGALSERGVAFTRYDGMEQDDAGVWTAPSGTKVAWFEDPDGNVLSLSEAPTRV
jgi:catechol 2,3-dioxygenase-like lactoylglutathione lyase family enzyme